MDTKMWMENVYAHNRLKCMKEFVRACLFLSQQSTIYPGLVVNVVCVIVHVTRKRDVINATVIDHSTSHNTGNADVAQILHWLIENVYVSTPTIINLWTPQYAFA